MHNRLENALIVKHIINNKEACSRDSDYHKQRH